MFSLQDTAHVVAMGVGATAVMDAWLWLLARLGAPGTNIAFIGRWVGHLARGRVAHASIAKAPAIAGEHALGWLTHYAVGIAFAGLLVAVQGRAWLHQPTPGPALTLGLGTVVLPLFVMQPAMGAGMAARRTPTPWRNRLRSTASHVVFGAGLYLAAVLAARAGG